MEKAQNWAATDCIRLRAARVSARGGWIPHAGDSPIPLAFKSQVRPGRRSRGNYCESFPGNSSSHPPCAHRLAGGRETVWRGARLVPSTTSGVYLQPRGPCAEPEGGPPSQDCQATAGGTADLAVFGRKPPSSRMKCSWTGLARNMAVEAFYASGTRPSEAQEQHPAARS